MSRVGISLTLREKSGEGRFYTRQRDARPASDPLGP